MSIPVTKLSPYEQCINLCLDNGLDDCVNQCGEKSDSFSLNPFKYIDFSSRAFKQGIATIANPYSVAGISGLTALIETRGNLMAASVFGLTGLMMLAPIIISTYDHYQASKTGEVTRLEAIGGTALDLGIAVLSQIGGSYLGLRLGIGISGFVSPFSKWGIPLLLGGGSIGRFVGTFVLSYGLTALKDHYFDSIGNASKSA